MMPGYFLAYYLKQQYDSLGINFHLSDTFDECVVRLPPLAADDLACVSADPDLGPSAMEQESMGFIYLDVGAWVGDSKDSEGKRRDFAVVHNSWVALCEFVSPGSGNFTRSCLTASGVYHAEAARGKTPPTPAAGELDAVYDLLSVIDGADKRVKVSRAMKYVGPYPMKTSDKPLLLLPDMHMPLVTGYPPVHGWNMEMDIAPVQNHIVDKASAGRISSTSLVGPVGVEHHPYINIRQIGVDPNDGGYLNPDPSFLNEKQLAPSAKQWFQQYLAAEITKDAGADLLELVARFDARKEKATLVHMGDLVDFWIGFDCLFEETPEASPQVILKQATSKQISGQEFLNYWCPRLLDQELGTSAWEPGKPALKHQYSQNGVYNAKALAAMAAAGQPVFLWGNHDNYLADGKSMPSAMQPKRKPCLSLAGFFGEHGHQGDLMNRDGATSGQEASQAMMADPSYRWVGDYGVRGPKVEWAARMWFYTLNDAVLSTVIDQPQHFGIYAMAHSHIPMLAWVTVQIDDSLTLPTSYDGPPK